VRRRAGDNLRTVKVVGAAASAEIPSCPHAHPPCHQRLIDQAVAVIVAPSPHRHSQILRRACEHAFGLGKLCAPLWPTSKRYTSTGEIVNAKQGSQT
jgi:hypothetical protein